MVMLLTEYKDDAKWKALMKDNKWIAEFKRDGNRLFAHYDNTETTFLNRKGKAFAKDIPDVIKNGFNIFGMDNYMTQCVLDGEMVYVEQISDNDVRDHRTQAQCKTATPYYMVFDILELNGEDLRDRPWAERKHELISLFDIYKINSSNSKIVFMSHFMDKQGVYDVAEKHKMEGIVLKHIEGKYVNGKSKDCVKVKFKETDEFIVIGYVDASEKSTNSKGEEIDNKRHPFFQALCLAQYDKDGKLVAKGRCGGGFTDATLPVVTKLLNKKESFPLTKGESVGFNDHMIDKNYGVSLGKTNWIKQKDWFIIEILMSGRTEYNNPFQPRFLSLRDDKKLKECTE